MKNIFCLGLAIFVSNSVLANERDFRCMKSVATETPLRLQFSFPNDKEELGQVLYNNARTAIPVKPRLEKTVEEPHPGRPSVFHTEWVEVNKNGGGGTYLIMSQGALIYDFRHVSRNGTITRFEMDLAAPSENGCRWIMK